MIRDQAPGTSALTVVRRMLAEHHPAGRSIGSWRTATRCGTTSAPWRRATSSRWRTDRRSSRSAEPFVAAVALIGALRASFETAGIDDALSLLEHGLAEYAVKTAAP